jgi:hypothetical protein
MMAWNLPIHRGSLCPRNPTTKGINRPRAVLARACQHLWLVDSDDVYRQFTCVAHTLKPSPHPRRCSQIALISHEANAAFRQVTLSRSLHTPPLPATHGSVDYRWRNTRFHLPPSRSKQSFKRLQVAPAELSPGDSSMDVYSPGDGLSIGRLEYSGCLRNYPRGIVPWTSIHPATGCSLDDWNTVDVYSPGDGLSIGRLEHSGCLRNYPRGIVPWTSIRPATGCSLDDWNTV